MAQELLHREQTQEVVIVKNEEVVMGEVISLAAYKKASQVSQVRADEFREIHFEEAFEGSQKTVDFDAIARQNQERLEKLQKERIAKNRMVIKQLRAK